MLAFFYQCPKGDLRDNFRWNRFGRNGLDIPKFYNVKIASLCGSHFTGSNCGKNVKYFSRPFYCQGGPSSNMGQYCNAGGEPLVTLLKQSTELRTRYWQLQVHWPQETYEKLWWWLFLFWATYQRKPIIIMTHFSSSRVENRFLRNVIHYIPTGFS